mmetsp:Transcript_67695/g.180990  ORF Transcript_67695/g.180990 Transcript_67695/m.180990 type:complete len:248 (+) Transcript_67695:970-1713(+)
MQTVHIHTSFSMRTRVCSASRPAHRFSVGLSCTCQFCHRSTHEIPTRRVQRPVRGRSGARGCRCRLAEPSLPKLGRGPGPNPRIAAWAPGRTRAHAACPGCTLPRAEARQAQHLRARTATQTAAESAGATPCEAPPPAAASSCDVPTFRAQCADMERARLRGLHQLRQWKIRILRCCVCDRSRPPIHHPLKLRPTRHLNVGLVQQACAVDHPSYIASRRISPTEHAGVYRQNLETRTHLLSPFVEEE